MPSILPETVFPPELNKARTVKLGRAAATTPRHGDRVHVQMSLAHQAVRESVRSLVATAHGNADDTVQAGTVSA